MKEFIKFIIGGVISYGIKLILTFLLTDIFDIWYLLSYIITMVIIVLYGFFYNFYYIFRNIKEKANKFLVYTTSLIMFSIVDIYLVKLLTDNVGYHYLVAIIISTSILIIIKFIFYKKFVFVEYKNKGGNFFNKHENTNPLIKLIMSIFHNTLFFIIDNQKPKTMLDAGCGEGHTTNLIKKKFPKLKIMAIEIDNTTVKIAKKRYKDINIKKGDIYDNKFRKKEFDIVLSSEVLEHLKYPDNAIIENKRVGKKCIFSVPYEPWWRIMNILRFAYLPRLGNTPGHINHWSKKSFEKLLKKHFNNVRIYNAWLWNFALCWD